MEIVIAPLLRYAAGSGMLLEVLNEMKLPTS